MATCDQTVLDKQSFDGESVRETLGSDRSSFNGYEGSVSPNRENVPSPSCFEHNDAESSRLNAGRFEYGCSHYRRRCKIRAPCCNEVFDCRHCHNEAKNALEITVHERHDLPRQKVEKAICTLCNVEQEVAQICVYCGVRMGEYFCAKCKFWDDDVTKEQFHCNGCGTCRTGGLQNFFHCSRCGCCYANILKDNHVCIEGAMHHNCPVCFEFLFDSTEDITVLLCGHALHTDCFKEMQLHVQLTCPVCSKSIFDMSKVWERLDEEVAATFMPEAYQSKLVWILCNDCGAYSEVQFHTIGRKCKMCCSYNTRQIRSPDVPQADINQDGQES